MIVDKRILLKGKVRTCIVCNETKDLVSEFYFKAGNNAFCKTCFECSNRERNETRIHKAKNVPFIGIYKKCIECKIEYELSTGFTPTRIEKNEFHHRCKVCREKRSVNFKPRNARGMHPSQSRPYTVSDKAKNVIRACTSNDKVKGFNTFLSFEFVLSSIIEPCIYCKFPSGGLDRLDNNIGHTETNCVPCCSQCNWTRTNRYSHEEMLLLGPILNKIRQERLYQKMKAI